MRMHPLLHSITHVFDPKPPSTFTTSYCKRPVLFAIHFKMSAAWGASGYVNGAWGALFSVEDLGLSSGLSSVLCFFEVEDPKVVQHCLLDIAVCNFSRPCYNS